MRGAKESGFRSRKHSYGCCNCYWTLIPWKLEIITEEKQEGANLCILKWVRKINEEMENQEWISIGIIVQKNLATPYITFQDIFWMHINAKISQSLYKIFLIFNWNSSPSNNKNDEE